MSKGQDGLARALTSELKAEADAARIALRTAPKGVVNATGKGLAYILRRGDERSRLAALDAIRDVPEVWYESAAYEDIITGVANALEDGDTTARAQQAHLAVLTAMAGGPDALVNEQDLQEEADRDARVPRTSTRLLPRVLSVFTRVWVMTLGLFVLLFGIPALFVAPLLVAPGMIGLFALFVVIDAYVRRCRSCKKLLAAQVVRLVGNNYGTEARFRCCFCNESWSKQRYHN